MVGAHSDDNKGSAYVYLLVPDDQPPVVTNVTAALNPAPLNTAITVSANVDDSSTGNSNIADVEYSLNGGDWTAMTPSDGSFDSPSEDVEATLSGFSARADSGVAVTSRIPNSIRPSGCWKWRVVGGSST